jgi:hypothetical protein
VRRTTAVDRRKLAKGGKLQMLAIDGAPHADLRGAVEPGVRFPVLWVDIADPELAHFPGAADGGGVYGQGEAQGGATFARLEGPWYDERKQRVVFVSTSGGAAGEGQVWEYDPRRARLRLLSESSDEAVLDNPDDVTVSRDGGILPCEDGDLVGQRLLRLTEDGVVFPLAQNNVVLDGEKNGFAGDFRDREWAGASHHRTLEAGLAVLSGRASRELETPRAFPASDASRAGSEPGGQPMEVR